MVLFSHIFCTFQKTSKVITLELCTDNSFFILPPCYCFPSMKLIMT